MTNPCEDNTDPFENQIINNLLVYVDQGPDTSTFNTFRSNAAINYNSGVEFCGDIEYELVDASNNPLFGNLILTMVQTGANVYTITLETDDPNDVTVGDTYKVKVWFTERPTIFEYFSFLIVVECKVFDFETFAVDAQVYTVYTPQIIFSFDSFVQYPWCGYSMDGYYGFIYEYDSAGEEIADHLIPDKGITNFNTATRTFTVYSEDVTDVGLFKIKIFNKIALADQNPTYSEGIEISLTINNDCQYDEVFYTDETDQAYNGREYLHYIRGEPVNVVPEWTHTHEGCPLHWYYRVKDSAGVEIPSHLWEEDGLIQFDDQTGEFTLQSTSAHYKHDGDVWTIQLVQASTYSKYDGRESTVEFTVEFRDICWDTELAAASIITQRIEIIVWEDYPTFQFNSMVDVGDNNCGGYTHELVVVSGPKSTTEFQARFSMSCANFVCTVTGVEDTFPTIDWAEIFFMQIKGTLGTKRINYGRGINGNGLYNTVYSNTFSVLGIDPCVTTSVIQRSLQQMETTVFNPYDPKYQYFIEFTDQASVTYGITGFDKCGNKHYEIVDENLEKVNYNEFISIQRTADADSGARKYEIKLETNDRDHVGTYTYGVRSSLIKYPESTSVISWFGIDIGACVILDYGIQVVDKDVSQKQYYQISTASFILDYSISQYPCDYTPTISNAQYSSDPQTTLDWQLDVPPGFFYPDNDNTMLRITTYNSIDVGEYWFRITSTLDDESFTQVYFDFTVEITEPDEDFVVPNNTAPFFSMNPVQTISVFAGSPLNHTFGRLFDREGDNEFADLSCAQAYDFISFDKVSNSLIIIEGDTKNNDVGFYYCRLFVWDDNPYFPEQGEDEWVITVRVVQAPKPPKEVIYNTETDYNVVKLEPDSPREKDEPTFHIYSLTRSGLLTCTIEPPIVALDDISYLKGVVAVQQTNRNNLDFSNSTSQGSPTGRRLASELFKTENGFEFLEIKPVIELFIKPSHEEKVNLNFTWEVKSMSNDLMQIQLDFELPPEVSATQEPDMLYMTLWGSNYFKTQEGKGIKAGTTRQAPISPQYSIEDYSKTNNYAKIIDIIIKLTIVLGLFLQTAWGRSRLTVWAFIDAMQMIFYLPLFAISIPAGANQLLLRLFDNARLMLIPLNQIIQRKYAVMDAPYSTNFYDAGYNSTFLWPNLSGVLILLCVWLVFYFICTLMDMIINRDSLNRRQFRRVWQNVFSRLMMMLYMEIMLCCCLNLSNFIGKNGPRAALSSYLSIALVITLILFTMFILMLVFAAIVFPYNDENHDIRAFKAKRDAKYHFRYIGEQQYQYDQRDQLEKTPLFWMIQYTNFYDLFDGMINRVERHYSLCSGWLFYFLFRRVLLVATIFFLQSRPVLQILVMSGAAVINMGYLRRYRPFENGLAHIQMVINEWFVLFIYANMLLFTDFVDVSSKQNFGIMFQVVLIAFIAFNVTSIFVETIMTWLAWIRKQQYQILRNEYTRRQAYNIEYDAISEQSQIEQSPIEIVTKKGKELKKIDEISEGKESENVTDYSNDKNFTSNNLDQSQDTFINQTVIGTKDNFLAKYAKQKLSLSQKKLVHQSSESVSNGSEKRSSLNEQSQVQAATEFAQQSFLEYIQGNPPQSLNIDTKTQEVKSQVTESYVKEQDFDGDVSARARELTQTMDLGNVTARYSNGSQIDSKVNTQPPKRSDSVLSQAGQVQMKTKQFSNIFDMIKEKSRLVDEEKKATQKNSTQQNFNAYNDDKGFDSQQPLSQNVVRSNSMGGHSNSPPHQYEVRKSDQSLNIVLKSQKSSNKQEKR